MRALVATRSDADDPLSVLELRDDWPEPVDFVVDTVGEATWNHSLRALKPGGRIVTSGATTGSEPSADLARIFDRQLSIVGSTAGTKGEMRRLLRFMEAADIHPTIDSVHSFDEITTALQRAQHTSHFGKVVVEIASQQQMAGA